MVAPDLIFRWEEDVTRYIGCLKLRIKKKAAEFGVYRRIASLLAHYLRCIAADDEVVVNNFVCATTPWMETLFRHQETFNRIWKIFELPVNRLLNFGTLPELGMKSASYNSGYQNAETIFNDVWGNM